MSDSPFATVANFLLHPSHNICDLCFIQPMTFIGSCTVPFLQKRGICFGQNRSSFHLPLGPLHLAIHHRSEVGVKDPRRRIWRQSLSKDVVGVSGLMACRAFLAEAPKFPDKVKSMFLFPMLDFICFSIVPQTGLPERYSLSQAAVIL